jgi:hypothetical protein
MNISSCNPIKTEKQALIENMCDAIEYHLRQAAIASQQLPWQWQLDYGFKFDDAVREALHLIEEVQE